MFRFRDKWRAESKEFEGVSRNEQSFDEDRGEARHGRPPYLMIELMF